MKLQVIVGSTRPNRVTPTIARWVSTTAQSIDGIDVDIVDLAEYPLPFFDESISPRYNPNRNPDEAVQKFINKIAEADAYVFVTPEYNHSVSGVLKNAIDYLTNELTHKPATVVSHGTVGGARAAMMLKEILSESQAAIIPQAVALIGSGRNFDENGSLKAEIQANPYGPQAALEATLAELKWYSDALSAARN